MLKQLIQLFAEKFLVSKKEWVAYQSAHISSSSTEITVTPDGERRFKCARIHKRPIR